MDYRNQDFADFKINNRVPGDSFLQRYGPRLVLGAVLAAAGTGVALGYARDKAAQDAMFAPNRWHNVEFANPETGIWKYYSAEDVPKTGDMWNRYTYEVGKRNKFDRQGNTPDGRITLPDLDGNGLVGRN
jgi:hypothetical protein